MGIPPSSFMGLFVVLTWFIGFIEFFMGLPPCVHRQLVVQRLGNRCESIDSKEPTQRDVHHVGSFESAQSVNSAQRVLFNHVECACAHNVF